MKKHRSSIADKRWAQPNRTYADLRQKDKVRIAHCKCGMSWSRQAGFFERTNDMVFALERKNVGKKTKQCPVIRYRDDS